MPGRARNPNVPEVRHELITQPYFRVFDNLTFTSREIGRVRGTIKKKHTKSLSRGTWSTLRKRSRNFRGEELIVHRFEEGSLGLASALDLGRIQECRKAHFRGFWPAIKAFCGPPDSRSILAVCIPPGARLLISDIPAKLQRECGFQDDVQEAVFTQVTAAVNARS